MYTILIHSDKFTVNSFSITLIVTSKDLFDILCILNDSRYVIDYKVSYEGLSVNHTHFGWGPMPKWVEKFVN